MTRLNSTLLAQLIALALVPVPARAQAPVAIATGDCNIKATVEITELKRKDNVLTLKVRIAAKEATGIDLPFDETYILDAVSGKKYFVLRDSDKKPVSSPYCGHSTGRICENVRAGETWKGWWKFPAPPADTKQVMIVLPICAPIEDVTISDAQ